MTSILVGNLGFSSSADSVRSMFEGYGTVDPVSLVTDRETGRSRGFAFVEMSDDAEAETAIDSLHGSALDGRELRISKAQPRLERQANGNRGRRR